MSRRSRPTNGPVEMVGAEGSPALPLPRVSKQTGHSPSGASSCSGRPQDMHRKVSRVTSSLMP